MTLADIPAGEVVFIDANIFIFYFRPDPVLGPGCDKFLHRIEIGDIQGFTSSHVLTEMAHRLMAAEAMQQLGWPMTASPDACATILRRSAVWSATVRQVSLAADFVCQHGLLVSDSLIVSIMQHHGLKVLASHNPDFDAVQEVDDSREAIYTRMEGE